MSAGVKIPVVDVTNRLEDRCLFEVKDNYRTHDPWIFIKPRPLLNLFKQIHYCAASTPGRQAACQPVARSISIFDNGNGRGSKAEQRQAAAAAAARMASVESF